MLATKYELHLIRTYGGWCSLPLRRSIGSGLWLRGSSLFSGSFLHGSRPGSRLLVSRDSGGLLLYFSLWLGLLLYAIRNGIQKFNALSPTLAAASFGGEAVLVVSL